MIIDNPSSRLSSESKEVQTYKDTKANLTNKFTQYFNEFETPQVTKMNARVGYSAQVQKNNSSVTKANTNWSNSSKVKQHIYSKGLFKYRNPNVSASLKRVLEQINPSELKNIKNRREYNMKKLKNPKFPSPFGMKERALYFRKPSTAFKKPKQSKEISRKIGSNYHFKYRKTSTKTRKFTDSKWKKRSITSETSNSQKKKFSAKGSRSGIRKPFSKSKVSESNSKYIKDNSAILCMNKVDNKACKLKANKQLLSRNSLQARKNNYNPVETPNKKQYFLVDLNTVNQNKKNMIINSCQKGPNTFESIWSAYTDQELMKMLPSRETDKIMPLNLYQQFSQDTGNNTRSCREITQGKRVSKNSPSKKARYEFCIPQSGL